MSYPTYEETIASLQARVGAWGRRKGWNKPALRRFTGEPHAERVIVKLALITTEVSEAIEAVREGRFFTLRIRGKPEGMASELADIVIRTVHLADLLGIDLAEEIRVKMAYNEKRPFRHGGKRA